MRYEYKVSPYGDKFLYAAKGGEARSADYNIMPHAALLLKLSPVTRHLPSAPMSHQAYLTHFEKDPGSEPGMSI